MRAFLCLVQAILSKQCLSQEKIPLPGVAVDLNRSPEHSFRFRKGPPIAKQSPQSKLRLRITAAAQVYRPLQSLLCIIPAAQLQVSHTNLVISLIVIWESIRGLLEMVQTALGIVLLQARDALVEFMPRLSRNLKIMNRDGISTAVNQTGLQFAEPDEHTARASFVADVHLLFHWFVAIFLHCHDYGTGSLRWCLEAPSGIGKRCCDTASGQRFDIHANSCGRLGHSLDEYGSFDRRLPTAVDAELGFRWWGGGYQGEQGEAKD